MWHLSHSDSCSKLHPLALPCTKRRKVQSRKCRRQTILMTTSSMHTYDSRIPRNTCYRFNHNNKMDGTQSASHYRSNPNCNTNRQVPILSIFSFVMKLLLLLFSIEMLCYFDSLPIAFLVACIDTNFGLSRTAYCDRWFHQPAWTKQIHKISYFVYVACLFCCWTE